MRTKSGVARCCCRQKPNIPCPVTDFCDYYLADATDWLPVDTLFPIAGSLNSIPRRITQGNAIPVRTPFSPDTVSIKASIDLFGGASLSNTQVYLSIGTETGQCSPDFNDGFEIAMGTIFQTAVGSMAIRARRYSGGVAVTDEELDVTYSAGAELEFLATSVGGGNYQLDWKYDGAVIYTEASVAVQWYDPFYHLINWFFANASDSITEYTVSVTPCNACDGNAYLAGGFREFWYPDGAANADAQVVPGTVDDLVGSGAISEVAGGISGNQWELAATDTGRLSKDFTTKQTSLGFPTNLVDFSRDFTFSMWYQFDLILGGLECNAQIGQIGAVPANVDSFAADSVIFKCRGNVQVQAAIEISSLCKTDDELVFTHPLEDSADSKNLYVFAWFAQQRRFKIWVCNGDPAIAANDQIAFALRDWGSYLVPANAGNQRLTIGVPGGFGTRGRIDQPALWNRALNDGEVQVLWNGGAGNINPPG